MQRFQRILVGVDLALTGDRLTYGSTRAFEQALHLAARTQAELVLLHSTWTDIHEENHAIRPGPSAEGMQVLDELVQRTSGAGTSARVVLASDRSWLEIIRAVRRGEGDLVVVGRHNLEGSGTFLGGVARKLMRKCPCPVWVAKPDGGSDPRVIVAATDLTAVGNLAVELAAYLAQISGAALHLVHAYPMPASVPMLSEFELAPETHVELQELERIARKRLEANLESLALPVRPEPRLDCGSPSVVIREHIGRTNADLLVMGSVSRGGIAGLLLGNTAERLLDRVPCSLLTVKPHDFISPVV